MLFCNNFRLQKELLLARGRKQIQWSLERIREQLLRKRIKLEMVLLKTLVLTQNSINLVKISSQKICFNGLKMLKKRLNKRNKFLKFLRKLAKKIKSAKKCF